MLLAVILTLCGCGSEMPFNGEVSFHELSVTVPDKFVRDSTKSSQDAWVFERGWYEEMIILTRSDITGAVTMEDYMLSMQEVGAQVTATTFLGNEAVHSAYTKDGQYCQEMFFAYNGSFYAVALRGGTVEEFQQLLDTVTIEEA